jgi:hypothetical protein
LVRMVKQIMRTLPLAHTQISLKGYAECLS